MNDIFIFNDIISHLALQEIPIKGMSFTWSNMREDPLLEQLDWVFTSCQWTLSFPNTSANTMAKPISDHVPILVKVCTKIPKGHIFRFENHWFKQPGFLQMVKDSWTQPIRETSSAGTISAKFKRLRYACKHWGQKLAHIKLLIEKCNWVITFFDQLEEERCLSDPEFNFRAIV